MGTVAWNKGKIKGNKIKTFKTRTQVYLNDYSFFIIDTADLPLIQKATWMLSPGNPKRRGRNSYIRSSGALLEGKYQQIGVHRFLMNPPPNMCVDHIDGNFRNNRRSNLRIASHKQNRQNQVNSWFTKTINAIPGVTFRKDSNSYRVRVKTDGKMKTYGYFKTIEEAEKVAKEIKNKVYGEFSPHWHER